MSSTASTPLPYRLDHAVRLLIGARAVRALGQGVLMVDFALYLDALGWTPALIGAMVTAAIVFTSALTAVSGPLSDRFGRKPFLIGFEAVTVLAASACALTGNPFVLIPGALIGGFGHGGARTSPFAPIESAWLSEAVPRRHRGNVFSLRSAVTFFALAAGAALAGLPGLLQQWLPGAAAYRPLFGFVALMALLALWLYRRVPPPERPSDPEPAPAEALASERRTENRLLRRLVGINALNGLGIGLTGPLMAYWFSLVFDKGPADIAPVMAIAFVAAGATSLVAGRLTARLGVMRLVVWLRLCGLALLLALPLAPTFALAAALYVARMACNLGTAGARLSLNISLVRSARRGAAASLSSVATQVPRSIGPAVAGLFFAGGALATPFFLAAGFQAAYLFLYNRQFRYHDPSRWQ